MILRRSTFDSILFAVLAVLVLGATSSRSQFLVPVTASEDSAACSLSSLPLDIQNSLKQDFGSWRIQEAVDLSEYARKTWEGRKPLACPGIAVGLFQSTKPPSFAVLLVPIDHPDYGYRFLIFSRNSNQSSCGVLVVERSDKRGASNVFIRKVPISRFFNEESKKKFLVHATEGILMVDSGEEEYEVDLYFWSDGRFRQEPVDE